MNVLFLQRSYSRNPNPLGATLLFEALQREAQEARLAYLVAERSDDEPYPQDFCTAEELRALEPDLIVLERGMFDFGPRWRIPEVALEREVARGAVVMLCDVGASELGRHGAAYDRVVDLFGSRPATDADGVVRLFDPRSCADDDSQIRIRTDDMAYEDWLAPVYRDLRSLRVDDAVVLRSWSQLVATCNRSSTETYGVVEQLMDIEPNSGPFAGARRLGEGFLVLFAGIVTPDGLCRDSPENLRWLVELGKHLVDRVQIDRRRREQRQRVFISHRKDPDGPFASRLRDELRRRGFGTWLDERQLAVSDALTAEIGDAIAGSTHLVLVWSAACKSAPWIERELSEALAQAKPILVVRVDDTPVPAEVADLLRVEAQVLPPEEAGRWLAMSLERLARRAKRTG